MAIDDLPDEHEQGELVRDWLRRNGGAMVVGIVLGLGAIFGWRWWQQHQLEQGAETGNRYQATVQAIEAGNLDTAGQQAGSLRGDLYPTLVALHLSRAQHDAGRRDEAIATLEAASTRDPALARVVQLRLARLLLDADRAQDALDLVHEASHAGAHEVRGDAFAALGRNQDASEAYRQALLLIDTGSPQRGLVELKLSAVGGIPEQPEARS
jgi:predicted negative regulator of RcsB-dependent stress response